ncbi:CaiB/BaiF CoA transferase family protein [Bordetella hinzii]|uniref:CoA transferase n=2 Tax=Bordetella hinzii TaxID=103855 RepID=A0AAN1RTQ0_9BORD|nr:CoA transferase [Bordetella hinzii]AKQ54269.1 Formyl-coenzyme A transferase [Bordetella hinzii]AKQ58783.1 Formyl-coenzyme A transferase [Bordetella hinzii]AZW15936.1 CoA transferase [Bordetella hinzii]KCB26031.1 CoA-transferase family III protein [Bordetella hinzii OH87 BAL007II]KCB30821.1 CoA-transferase family III protein [Bordetella hinzii L60]
MKPNTAAMPLEGIKILDLSQIMAGPYCTMVLADLGAEVIKVEKPGAGDDSREMGPYVNGESSCFAQINRNKLGISLNLKRPELRETVLDMVRWADVLIENYRVGVARSLGLDYETLSQVNPRLVYCSISGYGQTGPYSGKGGFDLVAQGMTGIMSMTGEPDGRPLKSGIAIYDVGAGLTAAYAILAACLHQQRTGEGQHIDISLAECGLPWFIWEAAAYFAEGTVPKATGSRHRVSAPYQAFNTGDGYIIIGAANQRTWERLCTDVLGRPELIRDPRFLTNSDRLDNIAELEPLLEAEFARADAATWIARCEQAQVPCGPINDFGQAMQDPHYAARGMVEELDHPKLGRMKTVGIPTKFSRTPGRLRRPAPLHGQHTDEVLSRFGVPPERIAQWRELGVVQ